MYLRGLGDYSMHALILLHCSEMMFEKMEESKTCILLEVLHAERLGLLDYSMHLPYSTY